MVLNAFAEASSRLKAELLEGFFQMRVILTFVYNHTNVHTF